jgi:hypothetical protein
MSDHNTGPDRMGPDDNLRDSLDDAVLGRLVRLAADGELSAEEAAAYAKAKSARPELAQQEQAQRQFRAAVGRCMAGPEATCPQALRDRIAALTAGAANAGGARPALTLNPTPADAPAPRADRFSVWQRVGALAAAIVIIVAVSAYFRQAGPALPGGGVGVVVADEAPTGIQLAGFMHTEHSRCASHPSSIRKFTEDDLERVPEAFRDVLGNGFTTQDILFSDANFVAAGKCKVPGKGPSIHLVFETTNAQGESVEVSLYIQRCGDKRFEEGKAYTIGADAQDGSSVIGWRHDGLVYYLVTSSPETTRTLAPKLNAPALAGAI